MVKNTLRQKLVRDMWRSRMQFLAVILLCALGTWVFSGLDAAWRMRDVSIDKYFTEQVLADDWVSMPSVDKAALTRIRNVPGVADAQARTNLELKVDLPHEPTLDAHGYDGAARINVPLIQQGAALDARDLRGCLVEEQFALANGYAVGDRLTVKVGADTCDFDIRGLVLSPEHVITAKDMMPDPLNYGYMLYNAAALPQLPLNQALVTFAPGADGAAVERALEDLCPDALVVNHVAHSSTQRTRNDVTMFKNLSYVFPLLAFAVAAMIVLTTITRMLENQRIQMGTLKALGYRDAPITRHYMSYAFFPSLIGALLGLAVGRMTLPYILWDMEAAHYILPYQIQAPISWEQWAVCALAVALACAICLRTYRKSAREGTAALLRPKPPKEGSRLLLERIPGLWRRFGFNTKMVIRNLFRSKARTIMSLVGVLCCNMLIITSFGLQDSVKFFVGNYYRGTLRYDVRADLTADAGELTAYRKRIDAERVDGVMEKTVSLRAGGEARTTLLTVLEPEQRSLYLGPGQTLIALPESGVALTRKLADVMKLSVGQHAALWFPGDDEPADTVVTAIVDVNIGQGAYMISTEWERCKKGAFTPTALLVTQPTEEGMRRLSDLDELDQLKYPDAQYEQTFGILQSMTGIFSLMSGAALGLAFVVLYNMGILNFMERYREYATLKVLGYHQKEIRRLMTRENNLITLMGIALGVLPGYWLTTVVLKSCESSEMVFQSTVALPSILIACAVSYLFSCFVQWLLTRKVRTIDMVEALKSVE